MSVTGMDLGVGGILKFERWSQGRVIAHDFHLGGVYNEFTLNCVRGARARK